MIFLCGSKSQGRGPPTDNQKKKIPPLNIVFIGELRDIAVQVEPLKDVHGRLNTHRWTKGNQLYLFRTYHHHLINFSFCFFLFYPWGRPLFAQKVRLVICRVKPALTLCRCIVMRRRALFHQISTRRSRALTFKRKSFARGLFHLVFLE